MAGNKRICAGCIKESYLGTLIDARGSNDECDYCSTVRPTVVIDSLVDLLEQVLETYFEPTNFSDAVVIYGRDPIGDNLKDVLGELLSAEDEVLEDLAEALTDNWFDWSSHEHKYGDDPCFVERSKHPSSFSAEWRRMEESLRREARLVNPKVNSILERIFGPLLNFRTVAGNGVIVDAGPGTSLPKLYRARVFQSLQDLEAALSHPAREVGPPPSNVARAGRMNAHGVSVFYGASIPEIAVSEVRPPVGSHALVGTFNIVRALRILDLDKLEDLALHPDASRFDPSTREIVERNEFLRSLSNRMVMPVMPEHEDSGYLITQAIADFLATHQSLNLDGILFRSVQYQGPGTTSGRNVVLFNKASLVASSRKGEGAMSYVQLIETDQDGDHWSPEIHVMHPEDRPHPRWFTDPDERAVALEIDLDDLGIQEIKGVNFTTRKSAVARYSDPKRPADSEPPSRQRDFKWQL